MEDWITVALEEYKTLREESLVAIQNQHAVLRYGIAAVGGVIFAGFNQWKTPYLPEIIFLAFGPIVSYMVLHVWMGEVMRMMRAGFFLKRIEDRISAELPMPPVLSWENWLRDKTEKGKRPQMTMNYIVVIGLFYMSALASIGIGNSKAWYTLSTVWLSVINGVEIIFFVGSFYYVASTSVKLKNKM